MQKEYIVTQRTNLKAKNGSNYANIKIIASKEEAYTVSVWDIEENEGPQLEDIITVDMDYMKSVKYPKKSDFGYFRTMRYAEPSDPLYSLIPRPIDKIVWDKTIDHLLTYCKDSVLIDFINTERDGLYANYCTRTAASGMHHAFKGGLLNHTHDLLSMYDGIYPVMPPHKPERCIIGIMFHDYGKIWEYDENMEGTQYMYLMGHTYMSAHNLHNKLSKAGIENEERIRIVHCVLAHHGVMEYGAPVLPCTQEAVIVHYLDDLSARAAACDDTPNLERSFALGTKVVKG